MARSLFAPLGALLARFAGSRSHRVRPRYRTVPRRLAVERLETRELLAAAAISPVRDTSPFPNRAAAHLIAAWDTNGTNRIDRGDYLTTSSGALIDDHHLLTAGHAVYDNKPSTPAAGYANWIFAYPGQEGASARPFGEIQVSQKHVPAQYMSGSPDAADYDLAVLTLDRNIGRFTGHFGYGALSDDELERLTLQLLHYPAESGFGGQSQYRSAGHATAISADTIQYDKGRTYTTGGSSGAPVFVDASIKGGDWSNRIVGVHVRGSDSTAEAIRLDDAWVRYINGVLDDEPPSRDRPALVDYDAWFAARDSRASQSSASPGGNLAVSAKVFNAGTGAGRDVEVRFRLSRDQRYDVGDFHLGDATISSIRPFSSATATLSATLPAGLAAGTWFVVWSIDPKNEIEEFSTPYAEWSTGRDVDRGGLASPIVVASDQAVPIAASFNPEPTATATARRELFLAWFRVATDGRARIAIPPLPTSRLV